MKAVLFDRVALIQNGKFLSINTPQGHCLKFFKTIVAREVIKDAFIIKRVVQKDFVEDVYPFGEYHHVVMKDRSGEPLLRQFIREHNNEHAVLQTTQPDIEDCFIALMKN